MLSPDLFVSPDNHFPLWTYCPSQVISVMDVKVFERGNRENVVEE